MTSIVNIKSISLTLCLLLCIGVLAQDKEIDSIRRANRGTNVSWVNPKLPDGPGLEHKILDSKSLGLEVGYVVWTPESYASETEKEYPVIYFLHGMGGNESADSGGFSEWLQKSITAGDFPEAICVFPNGGKSGYRGEVESMIIDELIPLIDSDYRTLATPESRALTGFSMGGAGSVYLSIMHPELFCAAGSMGGGIRSRDDMEIKINEAIPVWKENDFGFFMANGDLDRPEAFSEFSETLKEHHVDYEVLILEETKHNLGLYYGRSAPQLLRFIGKHIKS